MIAQTSPNPRRGALVARQWQPQHGAPGGRRARAGFSYQAYVPTPIANQDFALPSPIAAAAADAEHACRELNHEPPTLPSLENLARQLLRTESVASSRIEGLVLSHRRLAKASFSEDGHDVTATSVLANIRSLETAVSFASAATKLRTDHLLELHRLLFAGTRDEHLGGVIRAEQNWIGGAASGPRNAEFIPPPPEHVAGLLDDLCAFMNRDDLPAAIHAAITHAQFETIHPFHDGNGRVGRALILTILRRRNLAPRYLPPVSLAFAADSDRYVRGLTSWRAGDENDWHTVFATALHTASTCARDFARDVAQLVDHWHTLAGNPRTGSGPRRLIDELPAHPVLNVNSATALLGGTTERARQTIARLEAAGVLRPTTLNKRNRAWECVGLFDLLDRFERSVGTEGRTPRPTR